MLDEATASVDPATQATILTLLSAGFNDFATGGDDGGVACISGDVACISDGGVACSDDGVACSSGVGGYSNGEGDVTRNEETFVEEYLKTCTMVIVAHRLNNVLNCDRSVTECHFCFQQ